MDLLEVIPNFNFSLVNILSTLAVAYVAHFLVVNIIYVLRFTSLPPYRPFARIVTFLLAVLTGKPSVFPGLLKRHETEDPYGEDGYKAVWLAFVPVIAVGRYEKAVEIISGDSAILDKGLPFRAIKPFFGEGIIASQDDKWKARRRLVRQQFSPLSVPHYIDSIRSISNSVNDSIESRVDRAFDIRGFFSQASSKMIVGKALGVPITEDQYAFVIGTVDKLLYQIDLRLLVPFFYFKSVHSLYLKLSGVQKMIERFDDLIKSAIRRKHEEIKEELLMIREDKEERIKSQQLIADAAGYDKDDIAARLFHGADTNNSNLRSMDELEVKRVNSLSELLLRSWVQPETGLTPEIEEAIAEEIKAVIAAGSDGPDSLLTWFIYILGCYPEYQERIFQEIADVELSDWTMNTVNSFTFLDQCFKEATRLYTSVPLLTRKAERDQKLSDGKVIPKGAMIVVVMPDILRDPKNFPEPGEYKPERFDANAEHKIPNGAYCPFGIRPRDCIGQRLAPFYIKYVVASLIKSYHLRSHRCWKNIDFKLVFVFKPMMPMEMTFTRRVATTP